MKFFTLAMCVVAVAALTPQCSGRVRRAALPQRTMMFYYNRPHPGYGRPFVSRNYEPHTAMSAFAAGNTVSAGSFYGAQQQPAVVPAPDCSQCNGVLPPAAPEVPSETPAPVPAAAPAAPEDRPAEEAVPEETPVVDEQPEEQLPNDEPVAVSTEAPVVVKDEPKNKAKVPSSKPGKRRPPVQEDEEEEEDSDEEESPLPGLLPGGKKKKGQGNLYNSYFPIFFGGYPSGRSGADGNTPGAATAIANSFSTGKGAVATSHATAYGGPAPNGNGYKKNGSKARYTSAARS